MNNSFNKTNYKKYCQLLANDYAYFQKVIDVYGFPPLFGRSISFETLVQIILEQQVSLASARAAYNKLKEKIKTVTPENILALTNEELRACYFTKQKTTYVKHLAQTILSGDLNLKRLITCSDDEAKIILKQVKGIGDWTADVFLMMAMHRCDCFPLGDVALITSAKELLQLPPHTTKTEIELISNNWKPYRTLAAFMLWWSYINKKNIQWK
ncbi:MAG: DNA-3-methyladenine glycosylase 2 family protein [Bacteroidetes bacterium]|nr:DNA-3-methyladenine glycosylase 2 family protein [Bacteroidota bacterium]